MASFPCGCNTVLTNSIRVTIGGEVAPMAYAGIVGVGLDLLNVTVPNVPARDAVVSAQVGAKGTQKLSAQSPTLQRWAVALVGFHEFVAQRPRAGKHAP